MAKANRSSTKATRRKKAGEAKKFQQFAFDAEKTGWSLAAAQHQVDLLLAHDSCRGGLEHTARALEALVEKAAREHATLVGSLYNASRAGKEVGRA